MKKEEMNLKNTLMQRFLINIRDKTNLKLLLFIILISIVTYLPFFYSWNIYSYKLTGILSISSFIVSLLLFSFTYKKQGLRTFLAMWIIYKIIILLMAMIKFDIFQLKNHFSLERINKIEDVIDSVTPIIGTSFLITILFIYVLLLINIVISILQSFLIIKVIKKPKSRFMFSLFLQFFIIGIYFSIIYAAQIFLSENSSLYVRNFLSIQTNFGPLNKSVVYYASSILFIIWIPIFLNVNKFMKGSFFPTFKGEIEFAYTLILVWKIITLEKNIDFYPAVLWMIMVFTIIGLLRKSWLLIKANKLNFKTKENKDYSPYSINFELKPNHFISTLHKTKTKHTLKEKIYLIINNI